MKLRMEATVTSTEIYQVDIDDRLCEEVKDYLDKWFRAKDGDPLPEITPDIIEKAWNREYDYTNDIELINIRTDDCESNWHYYFHQEIREFLRDLIWDYHDENEDYDGEIDECDYSVVD